MSEILSDIDGYLTRHGYRRLGPDRAVWVPSDSGNATWPRAGDIALLVVDYTGPSDDSEPYKSDYAYMALQWVPGACGTHHWQVASCLPIRAGSREEALWLAVMWAVTHKTSLTLSALDLNRVTENATTDTCKGGNHG
jgi:hypothetical protein